MWDVHDDHEVHLGLVITAVGTEWGAQGFGAGAVVQEVLGTEGWGQTDKAKMLAASHHH